MKNTAKKRALFLCPSPFQIGTYFRSQAFARELVRTGEFEVDHFCTANSEIPGPQDQIIDGVRVVQTPLFGPSLAPMRGWNPGEILNRFVAIRKSKARYDLVYSFEYQPSVTSLAFPLSFFSKAVHFNDWCDWYAGRHHKMKGIRFLQKIDAWMEEFPRRRVDCVTSICSALYERGIASGVSKEKSLLIREGADEPVLRFTREEARARLSLERWNIPTDAFIIVAMMDQGTEVHEQAITELVKLRPNARLVLLGNMKPVRKLPTQMLSPGRVSDEDLDLWLLAADCAWLPLADTPLNRGRLPHKIGHFRMYGLPLITTSVGDVPDLGDSGILLSENTGEDFSRMSLRLFHLTEEERKNSQAVARQIYGWKSLLQPLISRINTAIQNQSERSRA